GPWAIRYSLSHLVKDEETLSEADWRRTWRILPHGSLAAGYLAGHYDTASISSAASTGVMGLRTGEGAPPELEALLPPGDGGVSGTGVSAVAAHPRREHADRASVAVGGGRSGDDIGPADLSDLGRSAGGPDRWWGVRGGAGGVDPGQFRRGELLGVVGPVRWD